MDPAVQAYVDQIEPRFRPLYDRLQRLILEAVPDAELLIQYQMPTFKLAKRKLSVGVWKHGVSLYGWRANQDDGFLARHPELKTSKGTIQLTPEQAEAITDDELRALAVGALEP